MRTRINRSHVLGASARLAIDVQNALHLGASGQVDTALLGVCRSFAFSSEDASEFAEWYLRAECLSKYQSPDGSELRRNSAVLKFWDAEEVCATSNVRLLDAFSQTSDFRRQLSRARCLAAEVLGRFDLNEFIELCQFGPGASTSLRRKSSSQQNKWDLSSHITVGALPYHSAFARWCDVPIPSELEVVEGNRVTTVPKNWKTDRIIAVEPDWNMFFQKGLGAMIRRRLQRFRCLTPDAQAINRRGACTGSVTGSLATLDLSAASDTISLALVEAIVPSEWLDHLLALRSPVGRLGSNAVIYEKISSMGNGYTFELETLIFWCLCVAVCGKEQQVHVYGDDIIVPTQFSEKVVDLLTYCGFSLNSAKSFTSGPFRESCGGHFFRGHDVTPFYLRKPVETMSDVIVLHNSILGWHARQGYHPDRYFSRVLRTCRKIVPKFLWGPYRVQGVLWADWDECCPRWNKRYQSYAQKQVLRVHSYSDISDKMGSYLYKLWGSNSDLVSSIYGSACSSETISRTFLDRAAWSLLPVRPA